MPASEDFNPLIIAVSARALFDMREENKIFEEQGDDAYRDYQREHRKDVLKPGTVFPFVQKMLALNIPGEKPKVEFVLITKNDVEAGHRVFHAITHYGLGVPRVAMTKGEFNPEVVKAYNIDLFLTRNGENAAMVQKMGIAAAQVYDPAEDYEDSGKKEVHIAFDGDKVLFAGHSENIYQTYGLDVYTQHERLHKDEAMKPGPYGGLLMKLVKLKRHFGDEDFPVKISLVSMRSDIRPLNTLAEWGDQYVDNIFFLGRTESKGSKLEKAPLLKAIGADIFFDDSKHHTDLAANVVPTGFVPDVENKDVPTLKEVLNQAADKTSPHVRKKSNFGKSFKKKP